MEESGFGLSPVQKLKADFDAPLDEYCILISKEEVDEVKGYIQELLQDPEVAFLKATKLMLLYSAAVTYIIRSFDPDERLDPELLDTCDNLAMLLYKSYKDIHSILWIRKIDALWEQYKKLRTISQQLPETSHRKVLSSKERLLYELEGLRRRIKSAQNPYNNI